MEVIFMLMLIVVTDGVSIGGHHRKRENLCRKYQDLLKTTINEQKEFNEANYVKRDDYNSVQQTLHDEIEARTKLERIVSLLQTQVSEIQRSIILISGHQKMIKELESQHKILERNLSTAVSAIEDLNKKSDACEEKNFKLKLKFDSSEQKLNQLKLDNNATQQKLAELMSLRDEFNAIMAKTKRIGKHFKDTCETDISCLEGLMCNNNLCECESLRYWNGSLCAPRKTFKDTCHADDHCIEGLICKNRRCECKTSSRYWNGSLCVPKVVPKVTVSPGKTTIPQGTTGTLRCSVTGVPQPTIRWSKSRGELTSNHQVAGETLRIVNAQVEDRGVYVCRAENTAGLGHGYAILEVERRVKPMLDIYPSMTQTIKTGESALFQCRVMGGDPPPTIQWSRAGGDSMTATTEIKENGVIMFVGVNGDEAGGYICTATNEMGSVTTTATLVIQGKPRVVISPSKKVYAIIGQIVSLKCVGEGDPIPSVQWRYDRPPEKGDIPILVEGDISRGSTTLTLNAVQTSDSGNYRCTATNEAGSNTDTVQVIVEDRREHEGETGVSIRGPEQLQVRERQTVYLQCDTEGIPNAVVRWRKRNGLMPPNHSVRGGTLTIPNFRSEYSGEYICSATSATQNYEASVFIIVTVPPSIVLSERNTRPNLGQLLELSCRATGSPLPTITWEKDGGTLPRDHVVSNGKLQIYNIQREDSGRYICTATSAAGVDRDYVDVNVQTVGPDIDRPIKIDTQTVNIGERVEMECVVTATSLGDKLRLSGDGFLEFDKSFLGQTWDEQVVKFTIRTTSNDGLIFYQGQSSPARVSRQSMDYVSVGLKNGYIEYSYDLGSGPAVIRSLQMVNDGHRHTIEVTRLDRRGTLKIDNKDDTVVEGKSQGILQMLNVGSNLYIGGVPVPTTMTSNRYTENFTGCIYDIYFMDKGPLRVPEDAVRGSNLRPCNS